MARPTGVTLIACFSLAAGLYYCAIGGRMLLESRSGFEVGEFMLLGLVPYAAVIIGLGWVFVGWGLLQLHDWARWAAQIMLAIGVALAWPMIYYNHLRFGWRTFATIAEIILRVLAIGYLFSSKIMDAFLNKRTSRRYLPASSPEQ